MKIVNKIKLIRSILIYIVENEELKFFIPFRIFFVLLWQIWKRTISLPIVVRLNNGILYFADPKAGNSTGAIYVSTYEKKYINFLRKNLSINTSCWIDVGANTGLFAMWFSDIFLKGYLFEPTPDLFNILKINININNLRKYKIYNLACSAKKEVLELIVTGKLSGNNRILNGEAIEESESIIKIKSISIDDLDIKNGIDFLKIDTEGSELSILEGAKNTLKKSSNAIALVENNDFKGLLKFFKKINWKIFDVDNKGRLILDEKKLEKAYNLICVGPRHSLHRRIFNN